MLILVTLVLIFIIYVVLNYFKLLSFWKKKGVKNILIPLPLFGNSLPIVLQRKSLAEHILNLYNANTTSRYIGIFQFNSPLLLVRDPELFKKMAIKEFDSFADHGDSMGEDYDPLWAKNLFASKGQKWRNLRHTLSPVFTSSKMKSMYVLAEDCAKQFVSYLKKQNKDVVECDLMDVIKRYTADVIATTAFGLQTNTIENEDNEFLKMGKELTNFSGLKKFALFAYSLNSYLARFLGIKIVSKEVEKFFMSIVMDTINVRTKKSIHRPDLINILMEARSGSLEKDDNDKVNGEENNFSYAKQEVNSKGKKIILSDEDIAAQATVFFFGGYDTTSYLINFCLYELVVNPEIKEKLMKEIDECCDLNNPFKANISYESMFKMKYLDMVVSETLRKWPQALFLDRKVVKPFTIKPEFEDELPVHLKPGDMCWFSPYAVQRDEKYWPNPDVFDPERFNDENKAKIISSAYVPFGMGPRNCIGSRYALMVSKIIIIYLLANFDLVPIEKTKIPLVLVKSYIALAPVDGFWFGFKKKNV